MKHLLFGLGISLVAISCSEDDSGVVDNSFDDPAIIQGYADQVIVPKYEMLDTNAAALVSAVEALVADPTDTNLSAAQDAWRATRTPWEQSESSLFGPVDSNGYDPALDSWPVNLTDINGVLASEEELNQSFFDSLSPESKGFHTIEFFLFGENGDADAEFTEREAQYLSAATADLKVTTSALLGSWTEGDSAYKTVFTSAGEEGNTVYPSRAAAAQEIASGIVVILDEVANGKIADPFDERDVTLVESPFSANSLADFRNNIAGAKEAYLGDFSIGTKSGVGLGDWVQEQDTELNARVLAEFDAAISAIEAIPAPFKDAILNDDGRAKIQEAVDAINTVRVSFESDINPLISGN